MCLVVVAPDDHGGEGGVDVEGAVDVAHPGHQLLTRSVHPGLAAPQPREDPAVHHQHQLHVSTLELQTKVREDFIITEKAFSLMKALSHLRLEIGINPL